MDKTEQPVDLTGDPDIPQLILAWLDALFTIVEPFLSPWTFVQFIIIAAGYALAIGLARLIEPRLETQARKIRERPRLLRVVATLLRSTRWLLMAAILWIAGTVIAKLSWPSRSYFILLAAELVAAWVLIHVATRVVRNRALARAIAIGLWILVALYISGTVGEVSSALDSVALTVGSLRLSPLVLIKGAFFLIALLWGAVALADFIDGRLRQASELTPSLQVLIGKVVKTVLVTVAFLVALSTTGIDLTALTVFSGAVGLGIGFGLQKVVSNLISGTIILMDKSIKPGDVISLGETFGWISSLRARYVSVVTRDGKEYLIPNEDFVTQQVINWSFTNRAVRQDIRFGTSYDNDPHRVRELSCAAVAGLERVSDRPPPVCHIVAFGDSSVDYVLRFWIRDPEKGLTNIRGNAFLALWDTFKQNDIDIPYPRREILMRGPVEVKRQ